MHRSASTLWVEWRQPELAAEQWEFFHHPAKQAFFQRHAIQWHDIMKGFPGGALHPYPRSAWIDGIPVSGSYSSYDDYAFYLAKAKRGYRQSYARMEQALQRDGNLLLPAPIVLVCNNEGLLFSGYRRLCLAWNYGMIPCVWLVGLERGITPCA